MKALIVSRCTTVKIIEAQQARLCTSYKNPKPKLLQTNAAVCFDKMCLSLVHQLVNKNFDMSLESIRRRRERQSVSGFRHKVDKICDVLGYYVASGGNFLSMLRGNPSVPN